LIGKWKNNSEEVQEKNKVLHENIGKLVVEAKINKENNSSLMKEINLLRKCQSTDQMHIQ
jgi:hypothetical protein